MRTLADFRLRSRSKQTDHGFTLLETLVALTILSLSVAVLFGIFSACLDRTRDDARADEARVLAERLLAEAETSPPDNDRHGVDPSGLHWALHVAPQGRGDVPAQPALETLRATIAWSSGGIERQLTLSTEALLQKTREEGQ